MSNAPPPGDALGDSDSDRNSPSGGPAGRLLDGQAPGPSIGELQREYSLSRPVAMIVRSVVRIGTGTGVPPLAEALIGALLMFLQRAGDDSDSTQQATTDTLGASEPYDDVNMEP